MTFSHTHTFRYQRNDWTNDGLVLGLVRFSDQPRLVDKMVNVLFLVFHSRSCHPATQAREAVPSECQGAR